QQRAAEEPPDEDDQFYRRVGPADVHAIDKRTKAAWFVVVGGPIVLLVSIMLSLRLPTAVVGVVIAAVVAGVVYLIARLPDRGPSNPEWPDDGAALWPEPGPPHPPVPRRCPGGPRRSAPLVGSRVP